MASNSSHRRFVGGNQLMTATGDWVTTYVYDGATAGPVGEIFTKDAGATASALGIWDSTGELIFERDKWMTWATDVVQVKLLKNMIYRTSSFFNLRIADGDIQQQTLKGSQSKSKTTTATADRLQPSEVPTAMNFSVWMYPIHQKQTCLLGSQIMETICGCSPSTDDMPTTNIASYTHRPARTVAVGIRKSSLPTTLPTTGMLSGGIGQRLSIQRKSRTLLVMSGPAGTWVHRQTIQTIHHRGSHHDC